MFLPSAIQLKQSSGAKQAESMDLLSATERDSLLALGEGEPSVKAIPGFSGGCLYDLLLTQAELSPAAVAVIERGEEITYLQLVQHANGVGQQLSKLGVGPESRVGILTDRSAESVIGVLGILAAGAAYVPLDKSFPDERIAFFLDNASVRVLLAPTKLAEQAKNAAKKASRGIKILVIAAVSASGSPPDSGCTPANAAYVIYTSGSTGAPKGVVVEHRGVLNFVQGFVERHNFTGHRLLMIPPLVFDASVGDVFPALAVGATLVLHPAPAELGALELEQFCREFRITAIDAPAALWRRWTERFATYVDNGTLLPNLTLMMFGGESVPLEQVRRFAQLTGNRVLLANHYGPTEAGCATMLTTRDGSEFSGAELPIGNPLPGVRVYVLDQNLQLTPRGAEGELCIGGAGVAREYLGLPELSAQRFVRDPFSPDADARMYLTGDLVRWNADGTLQFIGRRDHQVKIRGLRIELGEIEARLAEHPGVGEAVVLAREDQPGEKRLVAYITAAESSEDSAPTTAIDVDSLRAHLGSLLPEYMVPAVYVSLPKFPLTTNGKLDRKALPSPDAGASVRRSYEDPVGEAETTVARIWEEVLKLKQVGRNDNFFELGGHSLLAVAAIERMREAGLPVDVRAVFATPTLKDLARAVNGESRAVLAPPNLIPAGCRLITPDMLPLVKLSQSEIDKIVATVPGGAENIQDIYPLAPLQEGFLFHHVLEKEGDVYLTTKLLGAESREQLDQYIEALNAVIERHDILRTAVVWEGLSEPMQVVWRHALQRVEEATFDAAAGDIAEQLRVRFDPRHYRLDVRRAPLWRLFITEDVTNKRWLMLELMHHLIGDQTTLQVLQEEIQAILRGEIKRLHVPLPFRDFVAQARLGVSREEHEIFFTRMLEDVDEPTAPFGLTNVQGDGSQIVEAWRAVDSELSRRLRAQARALGVTVASVCHVAWALVLARASRRDDVVFGTVMFGRMQGGEGADRGIGLFINTLPVRIQVGDDDARTSIHKTHELLTQLLRHEHAPLGLAQRCSSVQAPAPLFTSLLNYRHGGTGETLLVRNTAGLQDKDKSIETSASVKVLGEWERTNFPFSLFVNDLGRELSMDVQVDGAIHPLHVCEFMHRALESLVEVLERGARTPVCHLEVLPFAERHQLLIEWNNTRTEYAKDRCIHELFEVQAAHAPDAIALIYEEQTLTYGELNQRANQLAWNLISLGVRPGVLVAICTERSLAMVVGLLGILKSGAAYVPFDPGYPKERLAYMMKDAEAPVMLTQASLTGILPEHQGKVLCLDSDWLGQIASQPEQNPEVHLDEEDLAYVIYTSGSTGQPKGAMNTHAGILNRLLWMQEAYQLTPHDAVLQKTPFSFDVSVWEFFWPLITGAQLVVARPGGHQDSSYLVKIMRMRQITTVHFVPSMLQIFLEERNVEQCSSLKRVICSGEALSAELKKRFFARLGCELHNLYGPTEAAVDVTWWPCTKDDYLQTVPIGYPIANTQMYVLDGHMNPSPEGVAGELYIGGIGLARGYWNRPELTAEKFLPNPFGDASARLYGTGDVGRYRKDGALEYLGRADHQVKIRGFRIELGEIEARLAEHPSVREAVVLAREDQPGDKRLVAYVMAEDAAGGATVKVEELRAHLTSLLPEYMVPAAYVFLEELPLTPNGKLDRKALPAPDSVAYVKRSYEDPVGEVEITIARIWAEVLKREQVGRNDNFFELGGHSLLAITLIERMREAGLPVDVRAVFATPTLKDLAGAVGGESRAAVVPPNLIPAGCAIITPDMLPLVNLSQSEIDKIVSNVPGRTENIQDIYPLAPLQEGILFHHLLENEGDIYLTTRILAIESREQTDRYARALQAVIERHDILRTAVVWEGLAEPVQVVWRHAPQNIEEVTLDIDAGDIADQMRARFDSRHYRLDVRQAPLWRLFIAEDNPNKRWVILELMHHLVIDHVTLQIVQQEMNAILRGETERLPAALPFRDFVAQVRQGVSPEEHEIFFTRMLGDVDEPTAPFGLTDVQSAGGHLAVASHMLDAELCVRLRAYARALGVSVASLCHLAWAVVLARTSARDDVVFGTVMSGRMQGGKGSDRVMGMFINTLPVRIRVGDEGVRTSVRATHELLMQLFRHEHAPLVLAQRCSSVRAPAPLFTSLFNYRHEDDSEAEMLRSVNSKDESNSFEIQAGIQLLGGGERSNYPFDVSVNDLGVGLSLDVQVGASIDPQRVCALMHTALESLATALERDPETPVCQLDVLPPAERRQVLVEWNATKSEYPADMCIHRLFEGQVTRAPLATAVVDGMRRLSYGDLNRRANYLARRLISLGVKPDDRIALCTERSLEMMVGILGILKAGGAYVPFDPSYPAERLEYMLADAAPRVVLTQERLRLTLPETSATVLVMEKTSISGTDDHAAPPDPLLPGLTASHLAYVIYTSGSTGKPKGVMVEHASVVNLICVHAKYAALTPTDRLLQFASFAFDSSVEEIFSPLIAGATLVLRPLELVAPDDLFCQFLRDEHITVVELPTAFWHQWAQQAPSEYLREFNELRMVVIGGEKAERRHFNDWQNHMPGRKCGWLNTYGPTEATVYSTALLVDACDELEAGDISIGRPVDNTQIYLLDAHLQPVPIGAVGELYIGGAGVARGYLNRPELTAERFLRDPFSPNPRARMYKTGDLGRFRPDGNIEYLGRNDDQVKIRGFRIELGEIEARLAEHASVRDALVLAREDFLGDKRLVAYVTAKESEDGMAGIDVDALRPYLSLLLPEYMVPSAYVLLTKLPLTPNGKVDRKALPAPDVDAYIARQYEAPVSELEATVARIWAEVLKLERVGRNDNFFELGGHSLLAVTVISRLRGMVGIDAGLKNIFTNPILKNFARAVSGSTHAKLSPVTPASRERALALSFAQQRLWFLAQMEGMSEAYHIPIGLRLTGELDWDALKRALDRIVWRHEALRTSFLNVGGQPAQQIAAPESGFALQEHDLSGHQEAAIELERRTHEEGSRPFDLEQGPLIRGQLIRLAPHEHVLLITMHHIVSDGWSMGVFTHELSELYRAFSARDEDPLPPLAIQYADYAIWQRQRLTGDVLERQNEYWRSTLQGAPALLELSTDRPRPAQQTFAGDLVELQLDAVLTRELKALSQRHGMTLYMLVVAGWAVVLSRLSGQEEVVIGTAIANRTRPEIEGLIGFFVNTQALRLNVSGSVAGLLSRVKERTLDAQEHQELPFEQVVEITKPLRSLAHTPIFQVMVEWQSTDDATLDLPGLRLAPLPIPYRAAKFDLELDLGEVGDRLVGGLGYATALFDRDTIERHAGYLRQALAAMVADERQAVDHINLLSPAERRQLLVAWNDTQAAYAKDRCIHELFEQQVKQTPEATAVVFNGGSVTYAELNRRANRLGHYLRGIGVKPEERVGICVERGMEMVVALLAVLKAGGAYVPLDPEYPEERLHHMVKDSAPVAVLTQRLTEEVVRRAGHGVKTIQLDSEAARWEGKAETNPERANVGLTPDHLAYVIYTSGSTGVPKGVMLEHRNTVNLICWAHQSFSRDALALTLFSTSLNFDLAVYECFVPLTMGACIRVVSDALAMARAGENLTLINTVPSVIKTLIEEGALPPTVQVVNVAGEPLKRALVEEIFARTAVKLVCNLYGPSETTTYSTWVEMRREDGFVPHIGRPIANTSVYILDRAMEPVPVGVAGGIYIGGAGVARGYLNRQDLTAERFLKNPFSPDPCSRIYRTGDLGRWLGDGNIEYLGRYDHQVKIRGFRIELGEIETRLAEYPGVREAVVVAREDHPGDKRLVAYVTAADSREDGVAVTGIGVEGLRAHLSAVLPEHMVPAAYVLLPKLPRTPNGKLDRKLLPAPGTEAYVTRGYEEPVSEMETTVARIWKDVLKLEQIGRRDDFFEAGGHSLLAVKVMGLLRQVGIETTVASLFNHPTVESFAASLSRTSVGASRRGAQKIREGSQTPLFLVHDGYGDELYFHALARYLPVELTVYGLPAIPPGEPQPNSMRAMAGRMINLLQEVQPAGPYRVAGWSFGGVLAYEIVQLLLNQGHAVEFLGLIDAYCPDVNDAQDNCQKSPEAILVELCEEQRAQRAYVGFAVAFDINNSNLAFDELFNRYRALRALPENLEYLSSREALAQCRNLEVNARVMAAYRPLPIGITVNLFLAEERPSGWPVSTVLLGWERCIPAHLLCVRAVPGTHESMMKPPHIQALGQRLTESLVMAAVTKVCP
jgi:amino acid adenylation domain-containing protein